MPVYIGVDDLKDTATNEMLEQGYVVAERDVRLRILYTFLKKNKTKKMKLPEYKVQRSHHDVPHLKNFLVTRHRKNLGLS